MADTLDVVSLTEARTALDVSSGDTENIEMLITAVSRQLDTRCGPIVGRQVTETVDGGRHLIHLRHTPILAGSTASVVEYDGTNPTTLTADTNTVHNSTGFLIDYPTGRLLRRSGGGYARFPWGTQNIVLTYTAGRYATTAAVDAKFKQAALLLIRNLYTSLHASGSEMYPMLDTPDLGLEPGVWVKAMAMLQREAAAPLVG